MTHFTPLPSIEAVAAQVAYDPATGLFRSNLTGKMVGTRRTRRGGERWLILVYVGAKQYVAHRLAWLLYYGADPGQTSIDHIDRDPWNNCIDNLRLANQSAQSINRRNWGKSKHTGITFNKATGRWCARVQRDNVRVSLGSYATEEEAAEARAKWYAKQSKA